MSMSISSWKLCNLKSEHLLGPQRLPELLTTVCDNACFWMGLDLKVDVNYVAYPRTVEAQKSSSNDEHVNNLRQA